MPEYGLSRKYRMARRIIDQLDAVQRRRLDEICRVIEHAQADLHAGAREHFRRCTTLCRGLCCKNVHLTDIIQVDDLVLLAAPGGVADGLIRRCLAAENPLFSADCIFLDHGHGPCMFPAHRRPETCIVTFCMDDGPVGDEIRRVTAAFNTLHCFVRRSRLTSWRKAVRTLTRAAGGQSTRR